MWGKKGEKMANKDEKRDTSIGQQGEW